MCDGIMFSCKSLPGISKVKAAVPRILSKFKELELPPNWVQHDYNDSESSKKVQMTRQIQNEVWMDI